VAGGEIIEAIRERVLKEEPEFDEVVALDAGIRRAALPVLGDEIADDALRKLGLSVEHAVRDAEMMTDGLGRPDIAAQPGRQLHGDAFDLEPLF
jgi:hypothetical protein